MFILYEIMKSQFLDFHHQTKFNDIRPINGEKGCGQDLKTYEHIFHSLRESL